MRPEPTTFQVDIAIPEIGAEPGDWVQVRYDTPGEPVRVMKVIDRQRASRLLWTLEARTGVAERLRAALPGPHRPPTGRPQLELVR